MDIRINIIKLKSSISDRTFFFLENLWKITVHKYKYSDIIIIYKIRRE